MQLTRFPRVHLCHCPTPLEPMENLSRLLGGPALYVKRDDCTGLATGGNKTRKLEFLMADALAREADTVITHGAVQSNHVRQTAAAAARLRLKCVILLERRVPNTDHEYDSSGNVFLDRLFGAHVEFRAAGTDMQRECEAHANTVSGQGGRPYVIPGGGSNRIGALGYVRCALELLQQANERDLRVDWIVHATGSAGTQAGLVAGFESCQSGIRVCGISVRHPRTQQEEIVYRLACETAAHAGARDDPPRGSVLVDAGFVGPGYGVPTPEMVEAVRIAARQEGLVLDPVYSGKAMAGLIGLVRLGMFSAHENVVFLHTGGSVSLFAYRSTFERVLDGSLRQEADGEKRDNSFSARH